MNVERFSKLLINAEYMAENLIKCPANEQSIGHMQGCTAQAIRDLVEAIRENSQAYSNNMKRKRAKS